MEKQGTRAGETREHFIFQTRASNDEQEGPKLSEILKVARAVQEELKVRCQFMDPREIVSLQQLEMAREKAIQRNLAGGKVAKDFLLEVLRIASGERQIRKALEVMGVKDKQTKMLILLEVERPVQGTATPRELSEKAFNRLLDALGLKKAQDLVPACFKLRYASRIETLGFETILKERLEAMALVDL